jgi:16S rRNA (guanine966-N2)-methyltransferase
VRIVAGSHRGRRIAAPVGQAVRPTTDRVRESLFNVLAHNDWDPGDAPLPRGIHVVDAFAGTGALGLEALSRGAAQVIFLENDDKVLDVLRRNIEAFGAAGETLILRCDATRPGRARTPAGLAFLDPPYRAGLAAPTLEAMARGNWFDHGAIVVVELSAKETFEPPSGFVPLDDRRYATTRIAFLRWTGALAAPE